MKTVNKEIVTASFSRLEELLEQGYICVSVVGTIYRNYKRKEEVEKLVGFSTYRMYHNEKALDYLACYLLYRKVLEKQGIEKILNQLNFFQDKHQKDKIALLGYGKENQFCYRHIMAEFLKENGLEVKEIETVDINYQYKLWNRDIYKERGHFNLDDCYVIEKLENSNWIFAKSMPKNPHSYMLRRDFGDDLTYLGLVKHIRCFGELEIYEGIVYRMFYTDKFKYWTMPVDIFDEDCDLINRKEIIQNSTKSNSIKRDC